MKKLYLIISLLLVCTTRLLAAGGPDTYGYTWIASTDAGGPTLAWKDISSTGTLVTGLADDNSAPGYVNLGFPFHFYWNDYTQIKVGSNGWISFSNTSNIASCFPTIPGAGGVSDDYLAPLMGDLNFTGAGNPGQCRYWTNGVDSFIISYTNVPFWVAAAPGWAGSNTFQIILNGQDSSITYQYQTLGGFVNNAGCVDLTVGIENSTGSIGLQPHTDAMPPSNYVIRFRYPNPVLISVPDVKANWNQVPDNKGQFYLGGIFDLWSDVKNVGTTAITSGVTATGTIRNSGGTAVFTQAKAFPFGLVFGADETFMYSPGPSITTVGQYTFNLNTINVDDINPGNNDLNTEIEIVNPCAATMTLGYSQATLATGTINWNGGATDDGVAIYIEPPYYPYTINSLEYFVNNAGTDGFIARVYDDDGAGGAAGTILFTQNVLSGTLTSGTWKNVPLGTPIVITEGGFYVASFQLGATYFIGTDNTLAMSRQNYEILDGSWSDFRFNSTQDLMIRAVGTTGSSTIGVDFTYVTSSGSYAVDFAHATAGATTLSWDFGDGGTATSTHPSHTYAGPGCYDVTLIASNACKTDTAAYVVCVCDAPVADFSSADTLLTVTFTDLSAGSSSWLWDFGDGATSTLANPVHTYAGDGVYNVCLIMTNACGESDTTCSTVTVGCPLPTVTYSFSSSAFVYDFTFTGTSPGGTTYAWDFGDGGSSTVANPTHTYGAEGTYLVCLIVGSTCGADTLCDTVNVVCPAPTSLFNQSTAGLTVDFTYAGAGATTYSWDFGDGGSSTVANPTHTYAADGMYNVCLVVTNDCGVDSFCDNTDLLVTRLETQGIGFTVSPNPTRGEVKVDGISQSAGDLTLLLMDLNGRVLHMQNATVSNGRFSSTLDLSAFAVGMYLLEVRSDKGVAHQRVVKE